MNNIASTRSVPERAPRESHPACEVIFAILAHDNPACLADQLAMLQRLAPQSEQIVFDASPECRITKELGIEPCAGSRPLAYARITPFHIAAMRAAEARGSYEFLVTLDSDTLLLKPGVAQYLRHVMQNAQYMAPHFREVSWWIRSDSHRRFLYCWKSHWQQLLGSPRPYRAFNCFQAFRKELVSDLVAMPRIDEIIEATLVENTALISLEELVYPTLAASLATKAITCPASYAIDTSTYSTAQLATFANDDRVYFLHKVTPDPTSPDWQFVRALSLGIQCDGDSDRQNSVKRTVSQQMRSLVNRIAGDARVLTAVVKCKRY